MKQTFIAIAALLALYPAAQAQKPFIAKEPKWVTINKLDYTNTSLDNDATDGYIDVDYEKQISLEDHAVYIRQSFRIISESGVQNRSQVSIGFDPTYQQLIFHTINIIRNGQVINKLDLAKIKTVHEEADLEDFIYNGTVNALLVLDDVRKGDLLEYSYTLKGFNPVFQDKYSTVTGTAFADPIYNLYFSVEVPKDRNINVQNRNETLQPQVHTNGTNTVYTWKKTLVSPLHAQDHLPDWYDPYPELRISEYSTWKEVNDWALKIFPKNRPLSPGLAQKIKEIQAAHPDSEGRVVAALRFVQDDIRYMGIEMGVHSHKPANPDKVFEQRFGDCKEKSYLLCTMLQAMGITASPVLISDAYKQSLLGFLPSVQNFDHVTVRARLNNAWHWFDPTISFQRGRLADIWYPDYQCGLVITDTTTALTPIPTDKKGMDDIKEVFDIPDFSSAVHLTVTSTYTGYFADSQRDKLKNNSNYDIKENLRKFYADYYEKITADSLTYTDNDSTGVLIRKAYFTIKNFWNVEKSVKKGEFSPFFIASAMKTPEDKVRSMPFSVSFPAKYHEVVEINLPEEWDIETFSLNAACNAFSFDAKCTYQYRQVRLEYNYEALKDNVQPTEADNYIASVKKAEDGDGFQLTFGSEKSDAKKDSSGVVIIALVVIGILVGGIIRWAQRR